MSETPPGWYPDPDPAAAYDGQRYWDGRQWTEHVHRPVPPPYPQPYAGRVASAWTGPTTPDGVPLAGWWQRVGAYLIDSLIVGVVSSLLSIPVQHSLQAKMTALMDRLQAQAGAGVQPDLGRFWHDYFAVLWPVLRWSALIGLAVFVIYQGGLLRGKGATVGMMALGIGVRLRERPGRLPWPAIGLRLLVQQGVVLLVFVPWVYLALLWFPLLDDLWPLWDRRRQALHDKAARTNVVRTR